MWRKPPPAILWTATARMASRSVKMPTSRCPSVTRRQSMCSARKRSRAVLAGASGLIVAGARGGRASSGSASRCAPSSSPGRSASWPWRSRPQLAQASSPARFSWPQAGQRMTARVYALPMPPPILLILADDLIWASRLGAAAERAGAEPLACRGRGSLEEALHGDPVPVGAIVDLATRSLDGVAAVGRLAWAGRPVLAVAQHDDLARSEER